MQSPATPEVHNKYKQTAPPGAVYIGRGSPWGNPFVIGKDGDRATVCKLFDELLEGDEGFRARVKRELRGKHLVCFCKPAQCHGDSLLAIANEP